MSRCVVQMDINDALHISEEQREAIIASYPAHEREARVKGVPALGSGRVYQVAEDDIRCEPFKIPDYWGRIIGIDWGWEHPTAAVLLAWDKDVDCVYVAGEYRKANEVLAVHASSIKRWGDYPVAWPHDVAMRDRTTGVSFKQLFKQHGLRMLPDPAQFKDGGSSVEAGVADIHERMHESKFKVFSTCRIFFEEMRLYHRKDGLIVKQMDDILDATRYGMMMLRFAKTNRKTRKLDYSAYKIV